MNVINFVPAAAMDCLIFVKCVWELRWFIFMAPSCLIRLTTVWKSPKGNSCINSYQILDCFPDLVNVTTTYTIGKENKDNVYWNMAKWSHLRSYVSRNVTKSKANINKLCYIVFEKLQNNGELHESSGSQDI